MRGIGHGQVWWADADKIRPVVILTRARVAPHLSRVLVAPITTTVRGIPSEVALGEAEGVKAGSVANLDNISLMPVANFIALAGLIAPERWDEFCAATHHVIGC